MSMPMLSTMFHPRQPRSCLPWLAALAIALLAIGCGDGSVPATQRLLTVGLITNNPNGLRNVQGFRDGMHAHGFVEGQGIRYLYAERPTPGSQLETAIDAMLADGAELIFTAGTPTGVAASKATRESRVPVVFGVIADPVAAGVMTDLSRPGGNVTGIKLSANQARRLELLRMMVPAVRRIAVPYNPEDAAPRSALAQLEGLAPKLGVEIVHVTARSDDEVTKMLAEFPIDVDAVFMVPDSTFNRRAKDLMAVAFERKLPVSGPSAAQVESGALMAYGIVHHDVGVQAAQIAKRILRGADPGALPVETARFFLTINVAAATRIGLEVPEELLQQADVITHEDRYGS